MKGMLLADFLYFLLTEHSSVLDSLKTVVHTIQINFTQ